MAGRALVYDVPFAAWHLGCFLPLRPKPGEGLTGLPGSEMPFPSVQGHEEGSGPRGRHGSSQPGPWGYQLGAARGELSALEMGCAGTTHAGHARPPSLQDVPPSPSPPWGGCVPQDPSRGSLVEQAAWPLPQLSGTPGLWGWAPQHAAGLGLSCSGSCPSWGEEGECKHPEHASTQGLGVQRGVWDPPAQQPLVFWDPELEGGARVGEGGVHGPSLCCLSN